MLLKLYKIKVPGELACFEVDPESNNPYKYKPKHLIPLGETMWPEAVKRKIASYFAGIGIEFPMLQKLVEPNAYYFGGQDNDLSKVKWNAVTDYFQWEAAAWAYDGEDFKGNQIRKLVEAIRKKYGGMFSHQMAYENRPVHG